LSGRDAPLRNRAPSVVSVGRFSPAKRQLEQIMLAEQLPHIPFHIVGFVGDTMYFDRCLEYVKQNRLSNVHVHPNATREQMVALLEQSKYFLHTLVNEPFGITAVQAIATGCIPIVHDSGGQRETVPIEFLRYKELNEVPGILGNLELLDTGATSALVSDLLEHARQNFDASVFHHKIKGLLDSILGTI
jgi:glycosyltransferase involved in cell wall biosynthesis